MTPSRARSAPPPFDRFFAEEAPVVARFLAGMVPGDDVDECLQESFLAALRAYDRFDGANPRGWILTIARRKAIDNARSRGRRPEASDSLEDVAAPGAPPESPDPDLWVRVAALPEKQRAAIVLRFRLDLAHREIGAIIGCSDEAARRNVHEGLKALRRTVAFDSGPENEEVAA